MGRTVRNVPLEPQPLQVLERLHRHVIQAIEPEAQRLLLQGGGRVLRDQEGYLYEEDVDSPWPPLVIWWPIQTRWLYLAARGQEDSSDVIFVAALLAGPRVELHLTYDDRPWDSWFGPLEAFFTLQVAQRRIFAEEANEQGQTSRTAELSTASQTRCPLQASRLASSWLILYSKDMGNHRPYFSPETIFSY